MPCSAYFASSTRWRSWPSFSGTVVEFSLSTLVKLLWRHTFPVAVWRNKIMDERKWKNMKGRTGQSKLGQDHTRSKRIQQDQQCETSWHLIAAVFSDSWWDVWILHKSSWSSAQLSKEHSGCGFSVSLWHGSLDTTTNIAWYAEPSACAIQWNYHSPSLTLAETHANTNNELVDLICRHAITYKYHVVPFVAEVECRAKQGNRWQSQGSCLCC